MNFGRTHYNKRIEENKQSVEEETNRDLSQAGVLDRGELSKALCTYQETSQAAI